MVVPVLSGAVIGFGLWLMLVGFRRRTRPLAVTLAELDQPYVTVTPARFDQLVARLGADTAAETPQVRRDLAMLGRTNADHVRAKLSNTLVTATFGVAAVAVVGVVFRAAVPPVIAVAAIVGSGAGGWAVTNRLTHQKAQNRRAEFRSTLATYLQLVSIMLAGGAGTNQALSGVTRFGSGAGFAEIDAALTEARVRGTTPWAVFAAVADRKGLTELEELAAAVELAGRSGARVRSSLLTKADTLRETELAASNAQAAKASEAMSLPVGLLMLSFVLLVAFPAGVALFSIS